MKALKVYENIEFERGLDPKEVLNLGPIGRIDQIAKDFGFERSPSEADKDIAAGVVADEYLDDVVATWELWENLVVLLKDPDTGEYSILATNGAWEFDDPVEEWFSNNKWKELLDI